MRIERDNRNPGIGYIKSDIDDSDLPFTDESFDTVILHNVLEHLSDPRRVLRESFRVLACGGILSVVTENQACLRNRLKLLMGRSIYFPLDNWLSREDRIVKAGRWVFTGHVREYTIAEIKYMLLRSGFALERVTLHAAAYPLPPLPGTRCDSLYGGNFLENMERNRWMVRLYNIAERLLPEGKYMISAIASKRNR
jgi:SAM-dependent methyltransferase